MLSLCLAAVPASAFGFEIFGIRLFGSDPAEEDVIADPVRYSASIEIEGAERALETALREASNLLANQNRPASGNAGLLATARGDYRRLLATLYTEGFYAGTISILVDGREAANLPPDTVLSPEPTVSIIVQAGRQFRFGRLEIINRAPYAGGRAGVLDQPESHGFVAGEIARSGIIIRAERLAVDGWRQLGHAKAEVSDRQVAANHDAGTVDVTIIVSPGPIAAYGEVSVRGTERMDPDFVARQAGLEPGRTYSPEEIAKARERLNRLEVFRSVRIEEAENIGADGLLPIDLIVDERPLRRIGAGASYSTIDGIGLEGYWLHRNLFGQAERLRLDARIGRLSATTFDLERYDYELGASFLKPGVFTRDTDYIANLRGERRVLERYTETSARAETGFRHIFTPTLSGRLLANVEAAQFQDVFGRRRFDTIGLEAGLQFDNRDSTVEPTRGFFIDTVVEPFREFRFDVNALKITAEARSYVGFGEANRFVLAGRIKAGSVFSPDQANVAPNRLYFAGGGGSVRGYPYRGIGVQAAGGSIVGGRSLIETSVEARARVTDTIGLVAFTDAGYVSRDSVPRLNDRFLISAGLGLRYYTGLGPIRLDVALPLNRRAGDPRYGVYVGIGQAF